MKRTELLAPARDYASGVAAINYGADALYVGGPVFGARRSAANSAGDIARLTSYARRYGVRVYAALNTIIFEEELEAARRVAIEVIDAGVDALIIQDMAFLRMGLPGVEFHASTQMSNTTPEGARFLGECGFSRVILERGLTLSEIVEIRAVADVELESFVHGAICVGTSGRCYLSRSMGSRSGNRGECGQPCRLSYDLVDGCGRMLIKDKHLLSVRDLDLSSSIGDLMDAGVTSFKIEGRLKDVGYVKNVVAFYRAAIDRELSRREDMVRGSSGVTVLDFEPDPSKSFTRAATSYFLHGKRSGVASFDTPKSMGSLVGRVIQRGGDWFRMDGKTGLTAGDGVAFFTGGKLRGTNINKVSEERIYPNSMAGIEMGAELWRNHDHAFAVRLAGSRSVRKIAVQGRVIVSAQEIAFEVEDSDGFCARQSIANNFEQASDPRKMAQTLQRQLSRAGDTIFMIDNIDIRAEGVLPFVPVSVVNGLRREMFDKLLEARSATKPRPQVRSENRVFSYPVKVLTGESNVVNSLAREFYRDHGVQEIEQGYDLHDSLRGCRVMLTPYCIRREMGMCDGTGGDLFLQRDGRSYRVGFDCRACMMELEER